MVGIIKGMGNLNCYQERKKALSLWNLLYEDKLTQKAKDYFDDSTAEVYFNPCSGYVFLSDEDCNTVMDTDEGELDLFINTPYDGYEGFFNDLMQDYDDMHENDKEYMRSLADDLDKEKYPKLEENGE